MRNITSLFLTLISYLIMLGAILALLFAAMPLSLRAQTNLPADTNFSSTIAVTNSPVAGMNQLQTNPPVRIDNSGIHAGVANPGYIELHGYPHERLVPGMGLGPTVVSIMPFLFPIAIIAVVFYFNHRRSKLAHETFRLMIEKGVPITPELIANLNLRGKHGVNPQVRYLLPGLILVGVGIGIITVAGKGGLIVLLIGVAFLIVWLVERKKRNDAQPPKA